MTKEEAIEKSLELIKISTDHGAKIYAIQALTYATLAQSLPSKPTELPTITEAEWLKMDSLTKGINNG